MLQIGSVSTVYLRGAQNTIPKNVWGIWGERGATERLLCENLSLCKRLLCCVSLPFCTYEYAALESLDWMCLYCIPKAVLVTSGGCFLSVYLDSEVGLS